MANALNKVKTSGVEDDAISLAKMAPGTDGQVLTYDASGNPLAVGPGTDGQVLTSTGAGSPPAFETLPTSGATLSGSTDNTVVTVTGANAMQGEANLTFDGTVLRVKNTNNAGDGVVYVEGGEGASAVIEMAADEGDDNADKWKLYSNASDNEFKIASKTSGSYVDKLNLEAGGNVKIVDGDLKIATAGHGIDFSATSDLGGMTSELLDNYEEGTWTPAINGGFTVGYSSYNAGTYIRVGRICYYQAYVRVDTVSGSSGESYGKVKGLPYACKSDGIIAANAVMGWFYDMVNPLHYAYHEDNTTDITILGYTTNGDRNHLSPAQVWQDGARLSISGCYEVD